MRPEYVHGKRVDRRDPTDGRSRICVRVDNSLALWLDEVARNRGIGRECIVETALRQLKQDMPR